MLLPAPSRSGTPRSLALRVAASLLALAAAAAAQAPAYHAQFLGKASAVAAMNDAGLVVGTGSLGIYPRAFVAGPAQPVTYLPLPFGFLSSGATDINASGVIVGVMSPNQTPAFYPQPARWDPDGTGGYKVTLLATLPGDNRGTADAINDLGDIVGTSSYQWNRHTVLYAPEGTLNLPGLGAYPPSSINDQRVYVSGNMRIHLDTLAIEPLGVPAGYTGAQGWMLNRHGQIAGSLSSSTPGCAMKAGLFTDGQGWQPVGPCGTSIAALDLDSQGDVLAMRDGEPFVSFEGGGSFRVEDLIVAASGHWSLAGNVDAALNDARQMAMHATNGGQSGILLITPDIQVTCQENLGFAGPGALHLSMCGGNLSSGTSADLALTGATPATAAWLVASLSLAPTPFKGGVVAPVPLSLVLPLVVGANGQASIPGIAGGHGPVSLYLQALQPDAHQPNGWALSNALQANFLP